MTNIIRKRTLKNSEIDEQPLENTNDQKEFVNKLKMQEEKRNKRFGLIMFFLLFFLIIFFYFRSAFIFLNSKRSNYPESLQWSNPICAILFTTLFSYLLKRKKLVLHICVIASSFFFVLSLVLRSSIDAIFNYFLAMLISISLAYAQNLIKDIHFEVNSLTELIYDFQDV
ncbi:hypothetical protein M0813_19562 [Anaeramoeba flamelloides]|uniref:Uncharacterized protein n=1 Tax=Anaeramoeba flamelloides TaxID=1746091 RepID=A0AAV7ZLC8_9EUKA|nr:hypothetical protein M0812_11830 [Anaeramoeba flamelloides]KAJ6246157.1 hypothetical protein M0813_19562 [Anaeramoeba flamelloides]